jgi:hypothetical protein
MTGKFYDIGSIEVDSSGRVLLNDADLEQLEADVTRISAGGVNSACINNVSCSNSSNSGCANSPWACSGSTNTGGYPC